MNKPLIFFFGAAVGSAATYFIVKNKFALETEEAINEEREYYRKKCSELSQNKPAIIPSTTNDISNNEEVEITPTFVTKTDIEIDAEMALKKIDEIKTGYGYSKKEETSMTSFVEPYEITLAEFTTLNGYGKETLTMYPDDILADENYELCDVADTVGYDMADKLPEYDNAEIYVRNDKLKIDYTLIRETSSYEEITGIFIGDYVDDTDDEY